MFLPDNKERAHNEIMKKYISACNDEIIYDACGDGAEKVEGKLHSRPRN